MTDRFVVRCAKKTGEWAAGVIISALAPEDVIRLRDPHAVLLASVCFYDQLRRAGATRPGNVR